MAKGKKKAAFIGPRNKPSKQRKRKNRSAPRVAVPRAVPMVNAMTVHRTCAVTDPFCAAARGSKWPDSQSMPTLAYTIHGRKAISSDSTGAGAVLVVPGFNFQIASPTVIAGTTYTFVNSDATLDGGSLAPVAFRIVSWGVHISTVVAPLSASGMLRIRSFGARGGAGLLSVSGTAYTSSLSQDLPLHNFTKKSFVGPRNNETFHNMQTPATVQSSSAVTNWSTPGYAPVLISFDGAAASVGVLDLEFFFNYELGFDDADSMNLMTTPSPAKSIAVEQASSAVNNALSRIGATTAGTIERIAKDVATQALVTAGDAAVTYSARALGTYFGGPMGGAMGGSMAGAMVASRRGRSGKVSGYYPGMEVD